ncbi:MAG: VanZ family protein [Candidatus Saccharibacteria bacterium]
MLIDKDKPSQPEYRTHHNRSGKAGLIAVHVITGVYFLFLLKVAVLRPYHFERSINLVPFRTISSYLSAAGPDMGVWFINVVGNIAVFVPAGILGILLFWNKHGFTAALTFTGVISLFIEAMQYTLRTGIVDIDDFILNVTGGIIGWLIWRSYREIRSKSKKIRGQSEKSL